jgi:hypothetical protein
MGAILPLQAENSSHGYIVFDSCNVLYRCLVSKAKHVMLHIWRLWLILGFFVVYSTLLEVTLLIT